jgi:3-oxoacyl-[acyl-carrier protein] reductase
MNNVLIIGGTGGLASGIVQKLESKDYRVTLTNRRTMKGYIYFDPLDEISYENLFPVLQESQHVIFNIGSGGKKSEGEFDEEHWSNSFFINFSYIIPILEYLDRNNFFELKTITFVGSVAGKVVIGAPISYSVAKAALDMLMKCLAKKIGNQCRVNLINPGNLLHETSVWKRKLDDNEAKTHDYLKTHVPTNSFVSPEEVGDLVLFILAPNSVSANGHAFTLDGGQTC